MNLICKLLGQVTLTILIEMFGPTCRFWHKPGRMACWALCSIPNLEDVGCWKLFIFYWMLHIFLSELFCSRKRRNKSHYHQANKKEMARTHDQHVMWLTEKEGQETLVICTKKIVGNNGKWRQRMNWFPAASISISFAVLCMWLL